MARDRKRAKQRQQRRPGPAVPPVAPPSATSGLLGARSTPHLPPAPRASSRARPRTSPLGTSPARSTTPATSTSSMPRSCAAPAACPSRRARSAEDAALRPSSSTSPSTPDAKPGAGPRPSRPQGSRRGQRCLHRARPRAARRRPADPRQHLPGRALAFLRASWAELQRVQWPNRSQVSQATAVVLGFVAVAGALLWSCRLCCQGSRGSHPLRPSSSLFHRTARASPAADAPLARPPGTSQDLLFAPHLNTSGIACFAGM